MNGNEFILNLINISPALGVLVWVVIYFKGQIKDKDLLIKALNEESRTALRDAYKHMSDINETLKEFLK